MADQSAWVDLVDSRAVAAGEVVAVDVGEREFVVWRTFEGAPCVMDARCPHQWSHLGAEGFVDGDELVCTAHFWRYDTAGHGCKLNIKGRRDPKADIEVFESREVDGRIEARLDGEVPAMPA